MKIRIIGTSHISPESMKLVKETILNEKPKCVALELDPQRYYGMLYGDKRRTLKYGITPFLLSIIQEKLSEKTGILPGSEMMTAVEAGREVGSRIVLIDKPIQEIMDEIKAISVYKKLNLGAKTFISYLKNRDVKIDLNKVPEQEIIDQSIRFMKKEMPEFYKILIKDRNKYMLNWIKKLSVEFDDIVVVVGAGHKKELESMVRKWISQKKK